MPRATHALLASLLSCAVLAGCETGLAIPEQIRSGAYTLDEEPIANDCGIERSWVHDYPVSVHVSGRHVGFIEIIMHGFSLDGGSLLGTSISRSEFFLDADQGFSGSQMHLPRSTPACPGVQLDLQYQLLRSSRDQLEVQASEVWTVSTPCEVPLIVGLRDAPVRSCRVDRLMTYTLKTPCAAPCELNWSIGDNPLGGSYSCDCPPAS